jgi:hypothetical protein
MLPPIHVYCSVTDAYSVTEFGPSHCREILLFKICYVTDMEAQKCLVPFSGKAQDTLAEKERERARERDSNTVNFLYLTVTTFLILLLKYEFS